MQPIKILKMFLALIISEFYTILSYIKKSQGHTLLSI